MATPNAFDAISLAVTHTRNQVWPFRWSQWWRLALLGLASGELTGGGCNAGSPGSRPDAGTWRPDSWGFDPAWLFSPRVIAAIVAIIVVVGLVGLVVLYVNSVCRFVLLEAVVTKRCDGIRAGWRKWRPEGRRFFRWQILFQVVALSALLAVVVAAAGAALAGGWVAQPEAHVPAIVASLLAVLASVVAGGILALVIYVVAKDFVVPVMALEQMSAGAAWRVTWPLIRADLAAFVIYLVVKLVLALVASVLIVLIVLVAILPLIFVGAAVVVGGAAASLTGTGIALAAVLGLFGVLIVLLVAGIVSVPITVFFPAYALHFFAARYPPLRAWLTPTDGGTSGTGEAIPPA